MGIFRTLFRDDDKDENEQWTRVRQDQEDITKQVGDRYTDTGAGHVHESYTLDKGSGDYREYSGGENSGDRNYNT